MCAMNPRLLRPVATSKYAALRVGLVAYWPLNENASSGDVTAVDATKRGNDLTSNNTVASTTGLIGNARQFVRSNSEYLSGTYADLDLGEIAWTITLWFYATTASSNSRYVLIGKDTSSARQFALFYNWASTNFVRLETFTTLGSGPAVQTGSISRDQWNFVSLTHEANSADIVLSVNRSSPFTATRTSGNWASFNSQFNIGRRQFSGAEDYADATIDEVAVWHRALPAGDLDKLYNSGQGIDLRR
jgi:hypothetical protein